MSRESGCIIDVYSLCVRGEGGLQFKPQTLFIGYGGVFMVCLCSLFVSW